MSNKSLIDQIIESLKDQKDFFGDDLLVSLNYNLNSEESKYKDQNINSSSYKVEEKFVPNLFQEDFQKADSLDELNNLISACQKCSLGSTRTNFVFGTGNPNADVMVIGEAPGAEEDKQGEPFVGRAGKLLNDILIAINFKREDVYIANILKCRPPNNRNPLPEEMTTCMPYLLKQIELIKPKVILCLGLVAAKGLLNLNTSLTKMRGNIYEFSGIKTMVTYHPAALLRNPNWKRGCWEDVQQFRKLYDDLAG